jgi:Holliday junction DNA helicase RuvB
VARAALSLFEVDGEGLDKVDKAILDALVHRFCGRPVGLGTLAIAVGEEPDTVEDVYEPYLLRKGFMQRTPRGRLATPAAFEHLGVATDEGRLL